MKLIIDIPNEMYACIKKDTESEMYIIDVIKKGIPYEPKDGWIPVSERLPEENGEYLVTREAYIDKENRNMVFVRDIANFTINYGLNNGFHKANTVIAWQPLPELYESEVTNDT